MRRNRRETCAACFRTQLVSTAGAATSVTVFDDKKKTIVDAAEVERVHGVQPHQACSRDSVTGAQQPVLVLVRCRVPMPAARCQHGDWRAVAAVRRLPVAGGRQQRQRARCACCSRRDPDAARHSDAVAMTHELSLLSA